MIADGTVADASADAGAAVAQAADLTAALMTSDAELTMKISVVYHFFGFLWVLNFVQLVAWLVMSGAVCWWYFLRKDETHKTRIPILRSLGRTMKYHLGSAAFAALIIAICQFLRAVMEYVDRQTRLYQDKNKVLKLIMKCAKCAMWCIEKTVRFISAYGLVFVALEGRNFCGACFSTFKFIVANPVQVGVNTVVTKLLILLSIGTIPVSCGIATFVVLEQRGIRNPMYSVFMAVLLAIVVTNACMAVFECAITSIFVCCFKDKAQYDSKYMSARLAKAFGIDTAAKKKLEEEKAEKLVAA